MLMWFRNTGYVADMALVEGVLGSTLHRFEEGYTLEQTFTARKHRRCKQANKWEKIVYKPRAEGKRDIDNALSKQKLTC